MYIGCNYLVMCVHWDLDQCISEQTYLCIGVRRGLFTEITAEGPLKNCIWPSMKIAGRVLYSER